MMSILFPAIVSTSTIEGGNDSANTKFLSEPLSFPTTDSDVAVLTKITWEIIFTYWESVRDDICKLHSLIVELVSPLYILQLSQQGGDIL